MRLATILAFVTGLFAASPSASADPTADVVISPDGDRVEVAYAFSEPVTRVLLPFARPNGPDADVRVVGALLTGAELTSPEPFTHVTLSIGPDRRERDSVYPLVSVLDGQGFVVYAPHLVPADMPVAVRILDQVQPLSPTAVEGYVLLGGQVEDYGTMRMTVSSATPPAFGMEAAQRARAIVDYYTARMERSPNRVPTVLLSYRPVTAATDAGGFRGDVSANGVVFLRVRVGAQATESLSMDRYTSFLAHEIFHLWNASRNPDRLDWWVHEGAAEYASWTAVKALWPATTPSLEERLTTAFRNCALYLGDRPLNTLSDQESRPVRYSCGAILQWSAALGAETENTDIFALWRDLSAKRDVEGRYTAADFLAAVDRRAPSATGAVHSIVETPGIDRWSALADTANGLGAEAVVGPPAAFPLRINASRALVLSACGEIQGVGDGPEGLYVQAPEGCDGFGPQTFIVSVNGVAPGADPARYFTVIAETCAAQGSVEIVARNDGEETTRSLRCTVPVDPAPAEITIRRALASAEVRRD